MNLFERVLLVIALLAVAVAARSQTAPLGATGLGAAGGALTAASTEAAAGVAVSTPGAPAPAAPLPPGPVITGVQARKITPFGAVITWNTDEAADSSVSYGPLPIYGSTATDHSPLPQHTVMLDRLAPGMTYHFQVLSQDTTGLTTVSADQVFTTPPSVQLPPGINLALGKQVTAYSAMAGSPSNVVDGNVATGWTSAPSDPQQLMIDLGASYWIGGAVLVWQAGWGKAYQIQVSQDAMSWTTVYTQNGGTGGTETASFAPALARYVQFYGTQRATGLGYSLAEFQVLSAQAPPGGGAAPAAARAASDDSNIKAPQKFLTPATQDGINDKAVFGPDAQEVTIVDLRGRQVFRASKTGANIAWDCRDGAGRTLSSGVYVARIKASDSHFVYQSFAIAK